METTARWPLYEEKVEIVQPDAVIRENPLTMAEIEDQLALLKARDLGVVGVGVGVGGHDSSDEVIALFADEFGESYRYVHVGEPIVVGAAAGPIHAALGSEP